MLIRLAEPTDNKKWDNFVHNHPNASPYHLFAWGQAVSQAYGFKTLNLIAEKKNEITGILPLSLLKVPLTKGSLVAMPYCDVGAVLSDDTEVQAELLAEAIKIGEQHNAARINLRGCLEKSAFNKVNYPVRETSNKVRMLLNLPGSSEELWKSFKSKLRSQVKKTKKNGLTFEWENDRLNEFYTVFSLNMRDLGSPVHSKKWFHAIISQFGDLARVGLVYHNNIAVGAGIILRVGNKISIPWASTLREFNRLGPNMLLYWNFLKYAADNNCSEFDFGRSTPNEGTFKFKSQWGAKPAPLIWHDIFLKGSPQEGTTSSYDYKNWSAEIWRKLPLNLANFFGPILRKYISL